MLRGCNVSRRHTCETVSFFSSLESFFNTTHHHNNHRVPHLTRSQLAKVSFPTFEAADRKRKEIESLYPKRFSKRYAAAMIQSKDDARISRSATLTKPLRVDGPFKVPRPPTVKSEHPSSGAPSKVPRPL